MPVRIIAEAGVNHNGDERLAVRLVDIAAAAGADVVKFQTFIPEELVSRHAPKADYQVQATGGGESQLEMVRPLRLDHDAHRRLLAHCRSRGITFLSTAFDHQSLTFLINDLELRELKIPSGEITNGPLLLQAARSGRQILMSTGMSTLEEIEAALGVIAYGCLGREQGPSPEAFAAAFADPEGARLLRERVTLLQCTTEYPAPFADINLRAMDTMAERFGLSVGLSDHSAGIAVAVAAAARGATVIEKHVTLDKGLPGPDQRASLDPDELRSLVAAIRQVEEALGDGRKEPRPSETKNAAVARKSLVAARAIRKGEAFAPDSLKIKRPGTGVSPMLYWDWLGRIAARDYAPDELIEEQT